MNNIERKLVTIVIEQAVESRLVRDLHRIGVKGHTVTKANGSGPHGRRAGEIDGGNVKIETVVSSELRNAIIEHLEQHYLDKYACVVWSSDVTVSREQHF
jgi:nitrogen regulatory protein PII